MNLVRLDAIRGQIEAASMDILAIGDDTLTREWSWLEARRTLRFGIYRINEMIEEATVRLALKARPTPAGLLAGRVVAARCSLHGALLPFGDLVDSRPGEEWTLRQVLTHLINSHEFWAWQSGHWLAKLRAGDAMPVAGYVRDEIPDEMRHQPEVQEGSLNELRRRLDRHVDAGVANLLELEERRSLEAPMRFQGAMVTIGYYPVRWSSHLREHRVQVDRTLAFLGLERTEVQRIVNLLLSSHGELESIALQLEDAEARSALDELDSHIVKLAVELKESGG